MCKIASIGNNKIFQLAKERYFKCKIPNHMDSAPTKVALNIPNNKKRITKRAGLNYYSSHHNQSATLLFGFIDRAILHFGFIGDRAILHTNELTSLTTDDHTDKSKLALNFCFILKIAPSLFFLASNRL